MRKLKELYADITARLDRLCEKGELDEYTKKAICQMSEKVIEKIASKYETVRKEVVGIMGGNILEYEAKTILLKGREEGREEGRAEGRREVIRRMIEAGFSKEYIAGILKIEAASLDDV